jgi:hypothetical protein
MADAAIATTERMTRARLEGKVGLRFDQKTYRYRSSADGADLSAGRLVETGWRQDIRRRRFSALRQDRSPTHLTSRDALCMHFATSLLAR